MKAFIPLNKLMIAEKSASRPVIWDGGEIISWINFEQRVSAWYHALSQYEGKYWALYLEDSLEFSAALLAIWQLERCAVLPGDPQKNTVAVLDNLCDGAIGIPSSKLPTLTQAFDTEKKTPQWQSLDLNAEVIKLFTSGSSGEPQLIGKALHQLSAEVTTLDTTWPHLDAASVTLSTVSHQHIYGLLFSILWPLSASRPISRKICLYSEDIHRCVLQCSSALLVSSPAHLSRLSDQLNWQPVKAKLQTVFSSTGPLNKSISKQASHLLGPAIQEIYGSTETGGIATRSQTWQTTASWQPFNGIHIRQVNEHTLELQSPHLPSNQPFYLPEKIKQHSNGRFELMGRTDRIAKIEGKRVSLSGMEKKLVGHPWVEDAKITVLDGKRISTAAVVKLNSSGNEQLLKQTKKNITRMLKEHLREQYEPVVTPKKWRFLFEFPQDTQGKVTQHLLQQLFEINIKQKWPTVAYQTYRSSGELCMTLIISDKIAYFDGHFPVAKILPGIAQTHWAQHYARQHFSVKGRFTGLEAIKFSTIIKPNSVIELKVSYKNNKIYFTYQSKAGKHTSGRFLFEADHD